MLLTGGLLLGGGITTTGRVLAHGGPAAGTGPTTSIGDGTATAYVERERGRLSGIGVRFDASALEGLPSEIDDHHLELPRGDAGRFEFVGVDWNPAGHEPAPVYGHPHFDFHFYMLEEGSVADIEGGAPAYEIPEALMPEATFTTAELGPPAGPVPREVVPGMGEHLVSIPASMPSTPGDDGWSVFIWGAHDPDGDGTGQLIFMEPMITVAYLLSLADDGTVDVEESSPIPMPDRFVTAGRYPTAFVVRYHADDEVYTVSLEEFEPFPGYGRR